MTSPNVYRKADRNQIDLYPTPYWVTRSLCHFLFESGRDLQWTRRAVWEPAAGKNHMANVLGEYFEKVYATDIVDYGVGNPVQDFLSPFFNPPPIENGWIVTNPPFNMANDFLERALSLKEDTKGLSVAFFCRTSFLESKERYERFFSVNPPTHVLQFVNRVGMEKDKLPETGRGSAVAYAWFIWVAHERRQKHAKLYWTVRNKHTHDLPPTPADLNEGGSWGRF